MKVSAAHRTNSTSKSGIDVKPSVPLSRVWGQRILVSAGVGVAVSGLIWWANDDGPNAPVISPSEPPLKIDNMRSFLVRQEGKRLWEIAAREIVVAPDGTLTDAHHVSNGVLFRDDIPFLHLSARNVRLFNTSNDLEATGDVRAIGPQKFGFQTPMARWNNAQKRIVCPSEVKATLRGLNLSTTSLSYDWDKGTLHCPQQVEVTAPGLKFTAPNIKASTKSHLVTMGGGVELIFDPKMASIPQTASPPASP